MPRKEPILTLQKLDAMSPGIFAEGTAFDTPEQLNVAGTGKEIKWVAVRGYINDWAIYTDNPYMPQLDFDDVAIFGDKIHDEIHIRRLIPCTDEAFDRYRH